MTSDEALFNKKPQSKSSVPKKTVQQQKYFIPYKTAVFVIVSASLLLFSCCIYTTYEKRIPQSWNSMVKIEAVDDKNDLTADENALRNENLMKEINEIKKQNEQLKKMNNELTKDNIALQNSLKIAASVGIKPQNFTRFNGITRGEITRGEYAGSFFGTAYTPSIEECGNNQGITNSGLPIIPGVSIAVDTRYWPIGTVFYIRGLGYAVAMDTGGAIRGKYRFDFAVFDKKFADELGAKYWDMYLVQYGNGKLNKIKF